MNNKEKRIRAWFAIGEYFRTTIREEEIDDESKEMFKAEYSQTNSRYSKPNSQKLLQVENKKSAIKGRNGDKHIGR